MNFIFSFGIKRRLWTTIYGSWSYLYGVLYRWPIFRNIIPLLICYASNARYQCICSVKICQNNTSSDWINYQQPNQIITKQEQNVSNEREILYSLVNAFPIDIIFDPSDDVKLYKILRYKNGGCLLNKFLQTSIDWWYYIIFD